VSCSAGASQVKWNRFNGNTVASSHDGDVRIWDRRKMATATTYIAAHSSKIHGLDWSPQFENMLGSASQDSTVKLWDVKSPRTPVGQVQVGMPVWRAHFTPFGHGLATIVVSQLRRSESNLLLWNLNSPLRTPIHAFIGHSDFIPDFTWRVKTMGDSEAAFQLVTWSKDQTLRQWKIDSQYLIACGHHPRSASPTLGLGVSPPTEVEIGSVSEDAIISPDVTSPPVETLVVPTRQAYTLSQEFSLLKQDIPGIVVEELDQSARKCTVAARVSSQFVRLVITFPSLYPNEAVPSFQFSSESAIDVMTKNQLIQSLSETAEPLVNQHRPCLEACLRKLVARLQRLAASRHDSVSAQSGDSDIEASQKESPRQSTFSYTGSSLETDIPFPRTCGGSFSPSGMLVVFLRPSGIKGPSGAISTPRALADLSYYSRKFFGRSTNAALTKARVAAVVGRDPSSGYNLEQQVSLRTYYHPSESKLRKAKGKHRSATKLYVGEIVIYDSLPLNPVNFSLAELYTLNGIDLSSICDTNATAAATVGCYELVRIWRLLSSLTDTQLVSGRNPDDGTPWATTPFGRQLLESIISHYEKLKDVQTLAMLTAVIALFEKSQNGGSTEFSNQFPFHNVQSTESFLTQETPLVESQSWPDFSGVLPTPITSPVYGHGLKSSMSWQQGLTTGPADSADSVDLEEEAMHLQNCKLLDPARARQYDEYKRAYSEILYCWDLLPQRVEMLKCVRSEQQDHFRLSFAVKCEQCERPVKGSIVCSHCKIYAFRCAVCHVAVKGSSNFCLSCGHGGHTIHLLEWFANHDVCPTGCGCHCLDQLLDIVPVVS
jgi:hypothetical protein